MSAKPATTVDVDKQSEKTLAFTPTANLVADKSSLDSRDVDLEQTRPPSPSATSTPNRKGSWRSSKWFITLVVFFGIFCDMFIYAVVIPILPFMVEEFGGNSTDVGILLAIYGLGILVSAPLLGVLSDLWTDKRLPMLLSLLLLAVATVLFPIARSYAPLLIARFCQGAASAGVWTLGLALVADVYKEGPGEKQGSGGGVGTAMGYVLSGYTLGQLVGPPIGGALYQIGRNVPFWVCGGFLLLDILGRFLVVEPERVIEEVAIEEPVDGAPVTVAVKPRGFGFVRLAKRCPTVLGLTMAVGMVLSGVEGTLPLHLQSQYGFNTSQVGLVFIAVIVPSLIFAPPAGMLYDRVGARPILLYGILASAVIVLLLLWATSPLWYLILSLFLFGGITATALTPLMPEIGESVPREDYAKAYSLFNVAFAMGIIVGPFVTALIYQYSGWTAEVGFLAAVLFVALPFIMTYKSPKVLRGNGGAGTEGSSGVTTDGTA
ncbi:hypothetical protein HK101_012023 [Irineochytrium annulatum]|nr:hypothetical protein HK101_012023 [Irineochytrium annulatum]